MTPGGPGHLVARFFDALGAKPLSDEEQERVRVWLKPAEAELFFSQPTIDQRHGYHAASVVLAAVGEDSLMLRAALLHDVGKRHAGLGVLGRSLASLLIASRAPLGRRARAYRDHGEEAARELAEAGSDPLVVAFARHHHGSRPEEMGEPEWRLLQSADAPSMPRWHRPAGIT